MTFDQFLFLLSSTGVKIRKKIFHKKRKLLKKIVLTFNTRVLEYICTCACSFEIEEKKMNQKTEKK